MKAREGLCSLFGIFIVVIVNTIALYSYPKLHSHTSAQAG